MTSARVAVTLALLAALSLASCTNADSAATARNMDSSVAASETMMLALRDSVKGVSEEEKARRTRAELAVHAPDNLDACSYPTPAEEVTRHITEFFTLELPADFELTRDADVDRREKHYVNPPYEWTASDGSTVEIVGVNNSDVHIGWTGLLSSECNLSIGSRNVHLDVANNTISREDRMVHAHFRVPPQLALRFVAHARSRARQAELLSAVHSIRVLPAWEMN